jgi:hypothetical protein
VSSTYKVIKFYEFSAKEVKELGIMVHTNNPSPREAEAEGS